MHISIHQSLRETSAVRLFILATFWRSWGIHSTRAASTSYSLVPSSTLKEYQWCAWLQGASLLTKCSKYILLCRYISVVPLVWWLPFETAALTGRLPSMLLSVNTLQVLFLKILNILSLQHLLPLFLLRHHLVELAVQRLSIFWAFLPPSKGCMWETQGLNRCAVFCRSWRQGLWRLRPSLCASCRACCWRDAAGNSPKRGALCPGLSRCPARSMAERGNHLMQFSVVKDSRLQFKSNFLCF